MIDWSKVRHVVCINTSMYVELEVGKVYTVREIMFQSPNIRLSAYSGLLQRIDNDTLIDKIRLEEITQRFTPLGVPIPAPYNDVGFYLDKFRPLQSLKVEDFMKEEDLIDD